jgi:hypothetical protein
MDAPYFGFELVKRAVILSMDRSDRERELTSNMIAKFYSTLLSSLQISEDRMLVPVVLGTVILLLFRRICVWSVVWTMWGLEAGLSECGQTDRQFPCEGDHGWSASTILYHGAHGQWNSRGRWRRTASCGVVEVSSLFTYCHRGFRMIISRHSVKRSGSMLEHVWSIGADAPLDDLKQSISVLVQVIELCLTPKRFRFETPPVFTTWKEYLASLDLVEAGNCVKDLNVPHFHHEGSTWRYLSVVVVVPVSILVDFPTVVKRACVIAMDKGPTGCESLSALLCYLYYQDILSAKQVFMGFQRVEAVLWPELSLLCVILRLSSAPVCWQALDDLVLDIPKAGHLFASIVSRAVLDGIITEYQADQVLLEWDHLLLCCVFSLLLRFHSVLVPLLNAI